jgi:large subunit ribosomal protein L25
VSENLLFDLTVNGEETGKRLALLQEVQHHTLNGRILHIDLHEVSADERVTIAVPVETEGEAAGVKSGGILEHVLFKLRVRALPKDLPEVLTVDVSHLEIGQAIHIGDIKPPAGAEILGDKHISVIAVAAPITEAQEAAAEAAAAATPGEVEMIKEKKEEGEEGAAPEKKAEAGAKSTDKKGEGAAKAATPAKGAEAAPAKGAEKKK